MKGIKVLLIVTTILCSIVVNAQNEEYIKGSSNPISCTEGGGWNFESSNGIRFPIYISGVGYKVA